MMINPDESFCIEMTALDKKVSIKSFYTGYELHNKICFNESAKCGYYIGKLEQEKVVWQSFFVQVTSLIRESERSFHHLVKEYRMDRLKLLDWRNSPCFKLWIRRND